MNRSSLKSQFAFIAIVLFSAFVPPVAAQTSTEETFRKAARASVNYVTTFGDGFTFGDLAPGFMYATKRNHVHELELNQASMDKSSTPIFDGSGTTIGYYNNRYNNFALRYQFTFNFLKKGRIRPQAGISLLNQYLTTRTEPSVSNSYPRSSRHWIALLALAPQLRYDISSRYFIDVALPVDILQFGAAFQKIENPQIPERQQRNGGFEFDILSVWNDALHVRIGGGIRF